MKMKTIWRVGHSKHDYSYLLVIADSEEDAISKWKDVQFDADLMDLTPDVHEDIGRDCPAGRRGSSSRLRLHSGPDIVVSIKTSLHQLFAKGPEHEVC